jgi:hypothetical protein
MPVRADVPPDGPRLPVGVGRVRTKPMGCEEIEVCIQIRQLNLRAKILSEPRASVQYRVAANRARWRYFLSRCYAEGAFQGAGRKHVGAQHTLRVERLYCLRILPWSGMSGFPCSNVTGSRRSGQGWCDRHRRYCHHCRL